MGEPQKAQRVPPSPLAGEGGEPAKPTLGGFVQSEPGEGEDLGLQRAKAMRHDATDAERKLWAMLRNRRLSGAKFRRQVPVGPYIADFICFELRLVVEADGGQHGVRTTDAARDAWFEDQGFAVQRFWNNDILANPDGVFDALSAVVRQRLAGVNASSTEPKP